MLNLERIRARLRPTFQPFIIRMTDGRGFEVPDYYSIAIGRSVVSVIDQEDIAHALDAARIADIEEMTQTPNGN